MVFLDAQRMTTGTQGGRGMVGYGSTRVRAVEGQRGSTIATPTQYPKGRERSAREKSDVSHEQNRAKASRRRHRLWDQCSLAAHGFLSGKLPAMLLVRVFM